MDDSTHEKQTPLLLDGVIIQDRSYWRWFIVLIVVAAGAANAMVLLTWAPIFAQASTYFTGALGSNSVNTGVNIMFSAFQIMYLPGTIAAGFMLKRYGLRNTMLYGGLLTTAGCLVRWATAQAHSANGPGSQDMLTYVLILIGTFMVAQTQPVYMNLPTVISLTWFSVSERDFAMTILSLANTAGSAMGSIVPTLLVQGQETTTSQLGPAVASLLFVQMLCAVVALLAVFFFFTSAPTIAPSVAAAQLQESNNKSAAGTTDTVAAGDASTDGLDQPIKVTTANGSMWQDVKKLLGSTQYVLLLCGFGTSIGSLNSLCSLLGQLPTNNTPAQTGIIGFCVILTGFFGAVSCGAILSKYKAYATTLKAAFVGALASLVCFFLSCHNDNFALMCVTGGLTGFFVLATIPAGLQCAVECTHPVSEDLAVGLMFLTANIVTIPYTFLGQAMLARNGTAGDDSFNPAVNDGVQYGWYAVFATSVLAFGTFCVVVLFRSGDYRRLKLDIISSIGSDGQESPRGSISASRPGSAIGSRKNSSTGIRGGGDAGASRQTRGSKDTDGNI